MMLVLLAQLALAGPTGSGPQLDTEATQTGSLHQKHHVGPWLDSLTEEERQRAQLAVQTNLESVRTVEGDGLARLEALAALALDRDADLAELGGVDEWLDAFPASEIDLYSEDLPPAERCARARVSAERADAVLSQVLEQLDQVEHAPSAATRKALQRTRALTVRFASELEQQPTEASDTGVRAAELAYVGSTRLLGNVLSPDKGALRATQQLTPELTALLTQAAMDASRCEAPERGEPIALEDNLR